MSCAAGTSLQPLAFWPDHSGENSPLCRLSAFARKGAMAAVARGKAGAAALIGPTSPTTRLTIPRGPAGEDDGQGGVAGRLQTTTEHLPATYALPAGSSSPSSVYAGGT